MLLQNDLDQTRGSKGSSPFRNDCQIVAAKAIMAWAATMWQSLQSSYVTSETSEGANQHEHDKGPPKSNCRYPYPFTWDMDNGDLAKWSCSGDMV